MEAGLVAESRTCPPTKGRIQLWSYNYDPEPTGIGPVSTTLARSLADRGWEVEVITAHPHYPEPIWGRPLRPYRETRNGIRVFRFPLWAGRDTPHARIRQELSYALALFAGLPLLGTFFHARPAAMIVSSPSFPALLPAVVHARLRRIPLVLWLHDLLPEGATATKQIKEGGAILRASRWLEATAYRTAAWIVVLSPAFVDNLRSKGVAEEKIQLIYHPATRGVLSQPVSGNGDNSAARILCMGNIGHSQGLAPLVRGFERHSGAATMNARLVITGNGVAAEEVAREVESKGVEMLGLVPDARLEQELQSARLALVTQVHDGAEFNLPSRVMNYMGYGLPVLAAVNPEGEVAHLIRESGAGWVVDSADPAAFPKVAAEALADPAELDRRGAAGHRFASQRFTAEVFAGGFDELLTDVVGRTG